MLFAGCDAGAQGVMYNLDYLNTMLPVDGSGVSGVRRGWVHPPRCRASCGHADWTSSILSINRVDENES